MWVNLPTDDVTTHGAGEASATSDVDGVGWLEAWGRTRLDAVEALQALAAQRVAQ